MMTEAKPFKSIEVCYILQISTTTLYQKIKDPTHPLAKARIPGLKPHRFKRTDILQYAGLPAQE